MKNDSFKYALPIRASTFPCQQYHKYVVWEDSKKEKKGQQFTKSSYFELLVYSYTPTGLPTPVCAKVVDREI